MLLCDDYAISEMLQAQNSCLLKAHLSTEELKWETIMKRKDFNVAVPCSRPKDKINPINMLVSILFIYSWLLRCIAHSKLGLVRLHSTEGVTTALYNCTVNFILYITSFSSFSLLFIPFVQNVGGWGEHKIPVRKTDPLHLMPRAITGHTSLTYILTGELDSKSGRQKFSLLNSVQTGCGVHPTTYAMDTGSSFLTGKVDEARRPFTSIYCKS